MNSTSGRYYWGGSVLSAMAYLFLAYATPRDHFYTLIFLFGLAFAGYFLLLRSRPGLWQGLVMALVLRLLFLFALPQLSDDYYRFIWDGALVVAGENPYLYLPAALAATEPSIPGISQQLFHHLNSPAYFSVYPPLSQAVFAFARLLAGDSWLLACVVMRLVLLAAEGGTLWLLVCLLRSQNLPASRAWLYGFNPLVIVELTGNLHFEALMVLFLTASLYLLWQGRWAWSAGALGLGIGVKLLPLMLLPLLLTYLGWKRFVLYGSLVAGVVGLQFLPFLSQELLVHFGSSLNLYFQKFEFNASIYYLLRWLGYQVQGYNLIAQIGPLLSGITTVFIACLAWRQSRSELHLARNMLFVFTVYLLLATVVHPWYLSTLVMLCCLSCWRYPLAWSAGALLSYAAYQTPAYQENLWLVALEYLLVFGCIALEIRGRQEKKADRAACD
ncbi:MAG: glycosyltransferase 87 family protein [Adhaeribacter sp.]